MPGRNTGNNAQIQRSRAQIARKSVAAGPSLNSTTEHPWRYASVMDRS